MKKNCEVCEAEYDVRPSRAEFRKTCSTKCSGILKTQKGRVTLHCYVCNKEISKTKYQAENSKSGHLFCSNECVGKFNSENNRQNIIKTCLICKNEFATIKAREEKHITCSKECHNKWQSEYRKGENSGNFRGGGGGKECRNCGKTYIVKYKTAMEKRMYCSTKCKQEYWTQHTLHNDDFKKAHFEGNQKYRENRTGETKPERMVREFLEKQGLVKDKDFFQEQGFFRRYIVDFFIPKKKMVIEVYGDFWHGNPDFYGEGLKDFYPSQIDRMEKDVKKEQDFIKYGFEYHSVWEADIYEDVKKAMKDIKIQ